MFLIVSRKLHWSIAAPTMCPSQAQPHRALLIPHLAKLQFGENTFPRSLGHRGASCVCRPVEKAAAIYVTPSKDLLSRLFPLALLRYQVP
jgi:hypothetical protein